MAAVIRIEVQTSGGLEDVKKDVQDLGKTAESSGGGFNAMQEIATGALRKIGEVVVNVGMAAFSKFGEVIGDSISAAKESNMVAAQTAQVIKSTGSAAGVTADHVLDYASALSAASGKSLFGDEQIAESSNLLLTFTNIKGATLDAATAISVDMAQALGGAPKDAAIQLGKALNDPIKGVTALTRVGVTFTEKQKATIQALVEHGRMAEAQGVILKELNTEFGGSAKAAADADGGFAQFQDRLGEMEETIGKALLPILGQLMGMLNDTLLPIIENVASIFSGLMSDFTDGGIGVVADDIREMTGIDIMPFVDGFNLVKDTITAFATTIMDTWNGVSGATASVTGDIGYFLDVLTGVTTETPGPFQTAFEGISTFITTTLIPAFQTVWTVLQTQVWPILQDLGTALLPLVGAAIQVLAGFWSDVLQPALMNAWTILTTVILPVLAALAGWLKDNLPGAIQAVADFLTNTLFPALHSIYDFIAVNVIPILQRAAEWLITNVPIAIQKASDFFTNTLVPALQKVWAFIQDSVIPIIEKIVNVTFTALNDGVKAVSVLWTDTLKPALDAVWTFLDTYINPILTKLANVVIALVKLEVAALAAIWNTVLLPAITAIWNFIHDKLIPIFDDIVTKNFKELKEDGQKVATFFTDTLVPAFTALYNFIYTYLQPLLDNLNEYALKPMKGFWDDIGTAVNDLIGYLNDLSDKWNAMKPPDWVLGHSPPPMANWFNDIGAAVAGVNAQLPTLQMNLAAQVGPGGGSIVNTASTRSFTYAPNISTTGNVSAPMDMALASSLAGV